MNVTIDPHSGFCFGVTHAIEVAERELRSANQLFCLGDLVHNSMEVERLKKLGLKIIDDEQFKKIHNCKVLIRAHGEPPETYRIALKNNIELIDATCPVVLNLQNDILNGCKEIKKSNGQIVIYGKKGHAEVNGLNGQTGNNAIIITDEEDIAQIDFSRPVRLYSQTTMNKEGFHRIKALIGIQMKLHAENQRSVKPNYPTPSPLPLKGRSRGRGQEIVTDENSTLPLDFIAFDTTCGQVSNRFSQLKEFAGRFDCIIFVSSRKSSNGIFLYELCKTINSKTFLVAGKEDIDLLWFTTAEKIGICGATSTPRWLMEEIAEEIKRIDR